uniref:Replication protein A large subunit n=1 Tax=Karenia brevis TaxID=156230 RepID=F8TZM7_KARBR|nr:replication protein A large subunit [Karenia brevis]|mmetsp:Transcript_123355/g.230632  ORF Transcript_123355/g.230632 Transcript_123355/m.230632 type:complete len:461 (-) Transcript_123355:104-1486(-)
MAAVDQFFPISEISPYHTKWTIKARVTSKAPVRTFGKSGGKVFSVDLLDALGGEIRSTFFNQAADKFLDVLKPGACFTFSKGRVRIADRRYTALNHRYELIFDADAIIEPAKDEGTIEALKFNITSLRAIQSKTLPCGVDLCGVVTAVRPLMTVRNKEGQELLKRDITIADDTATSMTVTLWAERAKQEDRVFEGYPVVGVKGVTVKEWNGGRGGSLLASGALVFKPTFEEAKRVQQWWSEGGSSQTLLDISQTTGGDGGGRNRNAAAATLAGVRQAADRLTDQPEIFSVAARLAIVQMRKQGEVQPLQYLACQEPRENSSLPCNRRVDSSGFCSFCNRAGKVAARLNIRCRFVDFEDQAWMTTFHEAAQRVLGMSAEDVRAMEQGTGDEMADGEDRREKLEAAVRARYFEKPLSLVVRAKLDTYNGEVRPNITVVDARPISRGEHGRVMLKEINQILGM